MGCLSPHSGWGAGGVRRVALLGSGVKLSSSTQLLTPRLGRGQPVGAAWVRAAGAVLLLQRDGGSYCSSRCGRRSRRGPAVTTSVTCTPSPHHGQPGQYVQHGTWPQDDTRLTVPPAQVWPPPPPGGVDIVTRNANKSITLAGRRRTRGQTDLGVATSATVSSLGNGTLDACSRCAPTGVPGALLATWAGGSCPAAVHVAAPGPRRRGRRRVRDHPPEGRVGWSTTQPEPDRQRQRLDPGRDPLVRVGPSGTATRASADRSSRSYDGQAVLRVLVMGAGPGDHLRAERGHRSRRAAVTQSPSTTSGARPSATFPSPRPSRRCPLDPPLTGSPPVRVY